MQNTQKVIDVIDDSILKSDLCISKIDPETKDGKEILEYIGYTGTKTRHLYNNIMSFLDSIDVSVKYLEIGTFKGSSSISSLYNNSHVKAVFIDNWSQFQGSKEVFVAGMKKYIQSDNWAFIEKDCWNIDLNEINMDKFNVYLYDGSHTERDHYKAISVYSAIMEDRFIYLVDDWNWEDVRNGTFKALTDLNLKVLYKKEIFVEEKDLVNMPNHNGKVGWWNGIGIFFLEKT